jgi:hypothetical protein
VPADRNAVVEEDEGRPVACRAARIVPVGRFGPWQLSPGAIRITVRPARCRSIAPTRSGIICWAELTEGPPKQASDPCPGAAAKTPWKRSGAAAAASIEMAPP